MKSTTDTLVISNTQPFSHKNQHFITPLTILKNWFDIVDIAPKDRVVI